MELVRCVSKRESNPTQIEEGKKYWIDLSSEYTDTDGDKYVNVYLDEDKTKYVGNLKTSHFVTIYRYLRHGLSLNNYVNHKTGFLLKDIIWWCNNNPSNSLAEYLILYIHDNKLDTPDNMEKEFVVNRIPFSDFKERGMEAEYPKYYGYSMYWID